MTNEELARAYVAGVKTAAENTTGVTLTPEELEWLIAALSNTEGVALTSGGADTASGNLPRFANRTSEPPCDLPMEEKQEKRKANRTTPFNRRSMYADRPAGAPRGRALIESLSNANAK